MDDDIVDVAEEGAKVEREAIVKWLRRSYGIDPAPLTHGCRGEIKRAAEMIERAEHSNGGLDTGRC